MRSLLIGLAVLPLCAAEGVVTFTRDVLPIVQKRCQNCHVSGEVAPMPLVTYSDVRPWAKSIREVVLQGKMPPWHADPSCGKRFSNDRSLTKEERSTIVAWVESGAKEGIAVSYTAPEIQPHGWKLGKPDWKVQIPEFAVPAKGTVEYTYIILPFGFTEDKWVRAAEYNVGERSVIHHINSFVRVPGSNFFQNYERGKYFVPTANERLVSASGAGRRQFILGYEPGYAPKPWGEGRAVLVPAGSDLVLELHYTASGKTALDRTQFGLYFATDPPVERVYTTGALNESIQIPAGDAAYRSDAEITFAKDVKLLSMQPHMHLRGKSMEYSVIYPSGETEILLRVPQYDFNWQTTYRLEQPLLIPAGSKIHSTAYFDNSANNRYNPDPGKAVKWGDQSWEEMHIGFMEVCFDVHTNPLSVIVPPKPRTIP